MRPPLPFSKEKAESSLSVISVPETSARPSPAASRISTSALRSERRRSDRVGDDRDARPAGRRAQRRQFGGEDACSGDHSPAGGYGRAPPRQGQGGKRKDQRHQHLVAARGRQRGGADRGDERRSGSPARPAPTSAAAGRAGRSRPGRAATSRIWTTRPAAAAHRFADAAAPHPPDLAHGHRQVAERVFAEVLGEVLLADLAERRVARQVRVAAGDPVEERRRVDFVRAPAESGGEVAVLVALDQQRLDPLVFAVGGQVGADVERLAAAGRDRHDAVEDDDVADRPGHDRQQQGERGAAPAPARPRLPAARPADPDRGEDDEGGADEAGTRAGTSPSGRRAARAASQARRSRSPRRLAQRKASTAAGRVRIAGGSLISSPVEWMNGG